MFNRWKKPPVEFEEEIKKIREHVKSFRKRGFCVQCQKPWYDGLCECADPILPLPEGDDYGRQKEIAMIAYRLMSEDVNPDDYL